MAGEIRSLDDMRRELKAMARRVRVSMTAISKEAGTSTAQEFVSRPNIRKGVRMKSLFDVFAVVGHELVATRPDMPEFSIRTDEELRRYFLELVKHTERSLTSIAETAGVSFSLPSWVTGSAGSKTVSLDPVLKIFNSEGVTLKLRKIQPTKGAAKRAMLSGS